MIFFVICYYKHTLFDLDDVSLSNGTMDSESLVEDDIRSDAGVFLTIAAIMTSLGVLFVAARICSRAISIRKYGADDYLCLVTVVSPNDLILDCPRSLYIATKSSVTGS